MPAAFHPSTTPPWPCNPNPIPLQLLFRKRQCSSKMLPKTTMNIGKMLRPQATPQSGTQFSHVSPACRVQSTGSSGIWVFEDRRLWDFRRWVDRGRRCWSWWAPLSQPGFLSLRGPGRPWNHNIQHHVHLMCTSVPRRGAGTNSYVDQHFASPEEARNGTKRRQHFEFQTIAAHFYAGT